MDNGTEYVATETTEDSEISLGAFSFFSVVSVSSVAFHNPVDLLAHATRQFMLDGALADF